MRVPAGLPGLRQFAPHFPAIVEDGMNLPALI
jgi:hypothetical protein